MPGLRSNIRGVDDAALQQCARYYILPAGLPGSDTRQRGPLGRHGVVRGDAIYIAVSGHETGHIATAQPCSGLDDSIEYGLQVEGRLADDLEHVARCSLVFERLLQIAGMVLQLVEQPHVLHRDDRLRRKVLQ